MTVGIEESDGALPGEVAYQALCGALEDAETVRSYRSKIVTVPGSGCRWWSGTVSGRGHGRFWLASVEGRDIVAIAHRFGFGLMHGPEALVSTRVLGHRCDNTLCQRIELGHVEASTPLRNRREWATRRMLAGSPLGDRRGARGGPGPCAMRYGQGVNCSRLSRQPGCPLDGRCRRGKRTIPTGNSVGAGALICGTSRVGGAVNDTGPVDALGDHAALSKRDGRAGQEVDLHGG
jgi:hypothetical protein